MKDDSPRARGKAATREKILAAARALFAAKGYEAVTMRELAKAIGMSTGVLFGQFAGKAALYEAATGIAAPDVGAFLLRLAKGVPEGTLADVAGQAAALRTQLYGSGAEARR